MTRSFVLYIEDIVSAMLKAREFTSAMTIKEFIADDKTQSAVVWQITIVGEATKHIPHRIRDKHKAIPWSEMARMRDKIVHAYFGVRTEIVWGVVKDRFPDILPLVKRILEELKGERLL